VSAAPLTSFKLLSEGLASFPLKETPAVEPRAWLGLDPTLPLPGHMLAVRSEGTQACLQLALMHLEPASQR